MAVTMPSQEVLERTDCQVRAGAVTLRFEVGFPVNGRTINAREHLAGGRVEDIVAALMKLMKEKGLGAVCGGGVVPAGLTMPRMQEIFACFDRY